MDSRIFKVLGRCRKAREEELAAQKEVIGFLKEMFDKGVPHVAHYYLGRTGKGHSKRIVAGNVENELKHESFEPICLFDFTSSANEIIKGSDGRDKFVKSMEGLYRERFLKRSETEFVFSFNLSDFYFCSFVDNSWQVQYLGFDEGGLLKIDDAFANSIFSTRDIRGLEYQRQRPTHFGVDD
ncbi:MAG: hypothetical protein WCT18_00540 [Patescibacteria group bacterium]